MGTTNATACSNALNLSYDIAHQDYWAVLDEEYQKAMEYINMDYAICDMNPNIGEFALLALKKGCKVHIINGDKELLTKNMQLNNMSNSSQPSVYFHERINLEELCAVKFINVSDISILNTVISQVYDYYNNKKRF